MRSARINLTVKEKIKPGETFCSLCARLRRGALYKYADELGCNKIALGHHADDFIETLLLNLFFNGQIKGMHARLRATNGRHTVIRPLVYAWEDDIAEYVRAQGVPGRVLRLPRLQGPDAPAPPDEAPPPRAGAGQPGSQAEPPRRAGTRRPRLAAGSGAARGASGRPAAGPRRSGGAGARRGARVRRRGRVTDRVRIGTRGSQLALRQAEEIAAGLRRAWPRLEVELVPIRTSGDRLATAHLAEVGGKGLFVQEIDDALREGRVDLAVHSLKDLPGRASRGTWSSPRSRAARIRGTCWWRRPPTGIGSLPPGARVGTSSLRRSVQLLARRPDVVAAPIRGNVDTRLRKLRQGEYDALVLAAAGLKRLGLLDGTATALEPEEMLPGGRAGNPRRRERARTTPRSSRSPRP